MPRVIKKDASNFSKKVTLEHYLMKLIRLSFYRTASGSNLIASNNKIGSQHRKFLVNQPIKTIMPFQQ